MTLLAVHWPNRHLESGELDRIGRVGCAAYIVYIDWLGDWSYWLDQIKQLHVKQPGAVVHLRLEKRGDLGNPSDEANQAATVANHFAGHVESWTWRNEPNIECPLSVSASAWQTWLTTFLSNARILSTVPVAAPPVSPGARDASGFITATANAAHAGGVKKKHIHFYGSPDIAQSDMDRQRQFDDEELIGTEYNFGAGNVYDLNRYLAEMPEVCRRAAARRIKTVGVFIWKWNNPPSIPTTVNIRDTVVESGMTAMQKDYPETAPPGGTMFTWSAVQFDRQVRDTWNRAGVVYNPDGAFAKYWTSEWRDKGRYLGAPEGQELLFEDTHTYVQKFAAVTLWCKDTDFIVHEGHPPLV